MAQVHPNTTMFTTDVICCLLYNHQVSHKFHNWSNTDWTPQTHTTEYKYKSIRWTYTYTPVYPVSQIEQDTLLLPITSQCVDHFSIFFTVGLGSKRVMKQSLKDHTIPQMRRHTTSWKVNGRKLATIWEREKCLV